VFLIYPGASTMFLSTLLTFICLRRSYISYDLGSRTVRSWRQNSVRCFPQYWPWNALRNRKCRRVLRKGWGKRDNNKRYTMRRMVLQYRVERVSCYKYGRYRHRCR
jgi:hypothetical protein